MARTGTFRSSWGIADILGRSRSALSWAPAIHHRESSMIGILIHRSRTRGSFLLALRQPGLAIRAGRKHVLAVPVVLAAIGGRIVRFGQASGASTRAFWRSCLTRLKPRQAVSTESRKALACSFGAPCRMMGSSSSPGRVIVEGRRSASNVGASERAVKLRVPVSLPVRSMPS